MCLLRAEVGLTLKSLFDYVTHWPVQTRLGTSAAVFRLCVSPMRKLKTFEQAGSYGLRSMPRRARRTWWCTKRRWPTCAPGCRRSGSLGVRAAPPASCLSQVRPAAGMHGAEQTILPVVLVGTYFRTFMLGHTYSLKLMSEPLQ